MRLLARNASVEAEATVTSPQSERSAMRVSWIWAASIVVAWFALAISLEQPFWAQQNSQELVTFGAIRGRDFSASEVWRLVVSQWLHVKFPHMLFNAFIIATAGSTAEAKCGRLGAIAVGLVGGTLAQLVTVWLLPDAFISGASQACLALCGVVLVMASPRLFGWWMAAVGVFVGVALDLFVSGHGAMKPGHLTGLAIGVAAGAVGAILRRGT